MQRLRTVALRRVLRGQPSVSPVLCKLRGGVLMTPDEIRAALSEVESELADLCAFCTLCTDRRRQLLHERSNLLTLMVAA